VGFFVEEEYQDGAEFDLDSDYYACDYTANGIDYIELTLDEEGTPVAMAGPDGSEWTIYYDYSDLYGDGGWEGFYYSSYAVPMSAEFEEGEYAGYELISISTSDPSLESFYFYDYGRGCSGTLESVFDEDGLILGVDVIEDTYSNCDLKGQGWTYSAVVLGDDEGNIYTVEGPDGEEW
jgi:hypothetical protein